MKANDLSSMQPGDAAVALRSLPRRFRDAALTASGSDLDGPPDDATIDQMAARVGPDGHSAADLVVAAHERVDALERLLSSALVTNAVIVPADALDGEPRIPHHPGARPFHDAVERLAEGCDRVAAVVDDADPARWTATISVDDGATTTPLDVLRAGVAALVSWERELAPLLRSVRGRPA